MRALQVLALLRKAVELQQLALYFDVDQELVGSRPHAWTSMKLADWDALFLPQRHRGSEAHSSLLRPVDGRVKYLRR